MKIGITSDIHLEVENLYLMNEEDTDVLILGGDILTNKSFNIKFLARCADEFKHVIYIAGNHEFYYDNINKTIDRIRDECSKHSNLYFLNDETKIIDDVVFIGSTLWTDCNKSDPITLQALKGMLNDFRCITDDSGPFLPKDSVELHNKSLGYIKEVLINNHDKKCVVVTHHSPSFKSCNPKYSNDTLMNGGFHSDLSEFILDHPQIKLWTHGHTHDPFDYMIGDTRIVCNPRGYVPYERGRNEIYNAKCVEI